MIHLDNYSTVDPDEIKRKSPIGHSFLESAAGLIGRSIGYPVSILVVVAADLSSPPEVPGAEDPS